MLRLLHRVKMWNTLWRVLITYKRAVLDVKQIGRLRHTRGHLGPSVFRPSWFIQATDLQLALLRPLTLANWYHMSRLRFTVQGFTLNLWKTLHRTPSCARNTPADGFAKGL